MHQLFSRSKFQILPITSTLWDYSICFFFFKILNSIHILMSLLEASVSICYIGVLLVAIWSFVFLFNILHACILCIVNNPMTARFLSLSIMKAILSFFISHILFSYEASLSFNSKVWSLLIYCRWLSWCLRANSVKYYIEFGNGEIEIAVSNLKICHIKLRSYKACKFFPFSK